MDYDLCPDISFVVGLSSDHLYMILIVGNLPNADRFFSEQMLFNQPSLNLQLINWFFWRGGKCLVSIIVQKWIVLFIINDANAQPVQIGLMSYLLHCINFCWTRLLWCNFSLLLMKEHTCTNILISSGDYNSCFSF